MTTEIPLSSKCWPGLVALVDDADAELVAKYSWSPAKRDKTFYARAYDAAALEHHGEFAVLNFPYSYAQNGSSPWQHQASYPQAQRRTAPASRRPAPPRP